MPKKVTNLSDVKSGNNFNLSKRMKIEPGNYTVLQLFVESQWEKNEIKNLGQWLKSQGVNIDFQDWHYYWKHKNDNNKHVVYVTNEDRFKDRIASELKNILPFLLRCNDDVNITNDNGQSILHIYLANSESDYRGSRNSNKPKVITIVKSLIEKGVSVNDVDTRGRTPIHVAIEANKLEIALLMLDFFSNVEACDKKGNTVLHAVIDKYSVRVNSYLDIVKVLLKKGADPNKKNKAGMTFVQLSVYKCKVDLLQILKEYGANFAVVTKNDENLLHLACKNWSSFIEEPEKIKIVNFLVDQGCDVNNINDKNEYSPLHFVVKWKKVVERLVELGADVDRQTKVERQTPLHLAVSIKGRSSNDIIRTLLCAGSSCRASDFKGRTALDIAFENHDREKLQCVLDFGGDINNRYTVDLWKQCYEKARHPVILHAVKLRTVGFEVDEVYKPKFINKVFLDTKDVPRCYLQSCLQEVNELKNFMVSDEVSIYQFMHMNSKRQFGYIDRLPQDLQSRFPVYANLIRIICDEAVRRNNLVEPAKEAWYETTEIYLPDICVERILYFLDNWHLTVLIRAAKRAVEKKNCNVESFL